MKILTTLIFAFFSLSCSNESLNEASIENHNLSNKLELKINGAKSTDEIAAITAFFSCNKSLNVTVTSKKTM
jgi:hypothetical protein